MGDWEFRKCWRDLRFLAAIQNRWILVICVGGWDRCIFNKHKINVLLSHRLAMLHWLYSRLLFAMNLIKCWQPSMTPFLPTSWLVSPLFLIYSICRLVFPVQLDLGSFPLCFRPSQPLLDRSIPDFTAFTSVEDWLSAIKMSQYRDNFLTAGFTSLQLVAQMTSE